MRSRDLEITLRCSVSLGHADDLESRSKQQWTRTDESTRRQISRKVLAIDGVERVEQRNIRAEDLDVNQVIHLQAGFCEYGTNSIEHVSRFLGGILRKFHSSRFETDAAGDIEGVASHDGVAEGQIGASARQIEMAFLIGGAQSSSVKGSPTLVRWLAADKILPLVDAGRYRQIEEADHHFFIGLSTPAHRGFRIGIVGIVP